MRFYAHAPRQLQKILNVQSYRVLFQLFLVSYFSLKVFDTAVVPVLSHRKKLVKELKSLSSLFNMNNNYY